MRPQLTGSILMAKSPTGNTKSGTPKTGHKTAPKSASKPASKAGAKKSPAAKSKSRAAAPKPVPKSAPKVSDNPRLPAPAARQDGRETRIETETGEAAALIASRDSRDYVLEANYLAELYAETLYDEAVAGLDAALADPSAANPVHAGFEAFLPGLMEAYENASRQWLDGAPDDAARGELTAVLTRIVGRLRIQAVAHEHAVRLRWRVETAEALLANKLIAAKATPEMAEVIRDAGDAVIDQMAALGTEAGAAQARRARFHADIARIAVEALIEADPAGALRRLTAGELDGLIGDARDGSGVDLEAGLKAYAGEAAAAHAADTGWLMETGRLTHWAGPPAQPAAVPPTVGGGDDAVHPETGAPDFDPDEPAAGKQTKAKTKK